MAFKPKFCQVKPAGVVNVLKKLSFCFAFSGFEFAVIESHCGFVTASVFHILFYYHGW